MKTIAKTDLNKVYKTVAGFASSDQYRYGGTIALIHLMDGRAEATDGYRLIRYFDNEIKPLPENFLNKDLQPTYSDSKYPSTDRIIPKNFFSGSKIKFTRQELRQALRVLRAMSKLADEKKSDTQSKTELKYSHFQFSHDKISLNVTYSDYEMIPKRLIDGKFSKSQKIKQTLETRHYTINNEVLPMFAGLGFADITLSSDFVISAFSALLISTSDLFEAGNNTPIQPVLFWSTDGSSYSDPLDIQIMLMPIKP